MVERIPHMLFVLDLHAFSFDLLMLFFMVQYLTVS